MHSTQYVRCRQIRLTYQLVNLDLTELRQSHECSQSWQSLTLPAANVQHHRQSMGWHASHPALRQIAHVPAAGLQLLLV